MIREAKTEDLHDILTLYQHLFQNEDSGEPEKYLKTLSQIINDKKIICFIAYHNFIPVSTCLITIIPNLTRNQRPYAVIENVVTHKDYRKKGYGKSVIKKAVGFAKQANCYKIMLLSRGCCTTLRIENVALYII